MAEEFVEENIYDKIRILRLKKGLNQEFMAEKLGMTQGNYAKIEKGTASLTVERIKDIASILDVSFLQLIKWDGRGEIQGMGQPSRLESMLQEANNRMSEFQDEISNLKMEKFYLESQNQTLKDALEITKKSLADKDLIIHLLQKQINQAS